MFIYTCSPTSTFYVQVQWSILMNIKISPLFIRFWGHQQGSRSGRWTLTTQSSNSHRSKHTLGQRYVQAIFMLDSSNQDISVWIYFYISFNQHFSFYGIGKYQNFILEIGIWHDMIWYFHICLELKVFVSSPHWVGLKIKGAFR